ncbi:HutD family protein [Bdellovibrio sp. 22V]|uniref:HutD/Ves family protein n=1 Tax=Bdellovibrio sp. 22V TaxID=3044166 RepID=UPI0025436BEE|nr:HutD family protein [Bdellovibrio sp. 22V]WII73577.1 HutD family protein [Bdellovibrio sp. 22V]
MTIMQRKISADEYKVMPWKNGLGVTSQISLVPDDAAFPDGDFLWRVSSATVRTSSAFSLFPGYDRFLVVWRGRGLKLNGDLLPPLKPLWFSGDDEIECELLGDEVIDVGVIFRREKVRADMTVETWSAGEERTLHVDQGCHYLFCAQGSFMANDIGISEGETLRIDSLTESRVKSRTEGLIFHIRLSY